MGTLRRAIATLAVLGTGAALALVLQARGAAAEGRVWALPAPSERAEPLRGGETQLPVRIRPGTTLGEILMRHGLPIAPVREAALPWHDLANLRPDRELVLVYADGEPAPVALRYAIDEDRTVVVERADDAWKGRLEETVYRTEVGTRVLTLTRSLWQDGLEAGLRPDDLIRLAKIFEYELDFNTELRDGARFSLVADVLVPEQPDRRPKLGDIHSARIVNGDKTMTAVRFVLPSGEVDYFHPDGTGMRRPFLRSPLEFSRITSGFNPKRFHPVLKTTRAHNGTDFGAPTGTPVRSVAEGKVVFAGKSGGHGNFVKIRHDGGYETSYSHLSRIRVKVGQTVRQGQQIGDVGATGLATGPHLHYQMWKNGKYVDPMRIELPNTSSLPVAQKDAFRAEAERWVPKLDEPPVVATSDEAITPR